MASTYERIILLTSFFIFTRLFLQLSLTISLAFISRLLALSSTDAFKRAQLFTVVVTYDQRWARSTSKVAPLPLLALKSTVATATRYSSSKVARYRYFTTKVAALSATATRYFEQRLKFFLQ